MDFKVIIVILQIDLVNPYLSKLIILFLLITPFCKKQFYMGKIVLQLFMFCFLTLKLSAQMPNDAIYMPKNTICIATSYSQNSWKEYWENTLKRENLNMGKVSTQSVMTMAAIGIKNNFNIIAGVPYIWTKTSQGNLMGQKGIQDFMFWAKYKMIENKGLSMHSAVGASIPISNYIPDFLPLSIGLQTKTATGRIIANYLNKSGLYFTAHASYVLRSNIYVDRDAYQADNKVYNSNEVRVPNATDVSAKLGWMKNESRIQTELFIERFACVGGDNIRRNDMPFPSNNMQMTSAGFYGKFQPKNIGINLRIAKVLDGLNIGKSTSYSIGFLYLITSKK